MKKRRVLTLLGSICLVLIMATLPFIAACAAPEPGKYPLKVGYIGYVSSTCWPLNVAQEKGYFAEEGLEVTLIGTYEGILGLVGGSFDISVDSAEEAILANAKGEDIVVLATNAGVSNMWFVVTPDIQTASDLRGKEVAVVAIPYTDYFLVADYLEKQGVSEDEVIWRVGGYTPLRYALIMEGLVSGTAITDAYALKAEQEGMKLLATPDELGPFPWDMVMVKRGWVETHPDAAEKFLRAIYNATMWMVDPANLEEAARLLSPISGHDLDMQRAALKASIEAGLYGIGEKTTPALLQIAADILQEQELIGEFDVTRMLDTSYYERAIK